MRCPNRIGVMQVPPESSFQVEGTWSYSEAFAHLAQMVICCCDDPSTQGARVSEVERSRFWSSFSGRSLLLKDARAWQELDPVISKQSNESI